MYFDEDGDLAEEFYEEVSPAGHKPWMKRVTEGLMRQVSLNVIFLWPFV